jgi:hypothetical protein
LSCFLLSYVSLNKRFIFNDKFLKKIRFGADIRTLNVMVQTSNSNLTVFTKNGPQGNVWRKGQVDYSTTLSYKIIFEGISK